MKRGDLEYLDLESMDIPDYALLTLNDYVAVGDEIGNDDPPLVAAHSRAREADLKVQMSYSLGKVPTA